MKQLLCGLAASLCVLSFTPAAQAFCGFYVSGADGKLFNDATQVALMRDGTRTVLAMQNDYKGPPQDFALVVPVPVILQKENVKTLSQDVFAHLDKLTAPRLVEYWEQDPCAADGMGGLGLSGIGTGGGGFGNGHGRLGGGNMGVTVEAEFAVGEYQILILSAKDSTGLDAWLRENQYKIPDGAADVLRPYVQSGSKFFVAKIDVSKVKMENGRAALSPLRFHYDADRLELPVKLGLLNSAGTQDLIVYVIGADRYEVANYPNVAIPTNLDVTDATRTSFGPFYASLFDHTVTQHPGSVVTEYSWQAGSCDPCPDGMQGLNAQDAMALGADVMPNMSVRASSNAPSLRMGKTTTTPGLPIEVTERIVRQNYGRFRLCYENGLKTNPNIGGKVAVNFDIDASGSVSSAKDGGSDLADPATVSCIVRGFTNVTFPQPETKKPVSVHYEVMFAAPGSPNGPNGGPAIFNTSKGSAVITRLHTRYNKGSLGSDLVFRTADPIIGGREMMAGGSLEHGAVPTTNMSAFQARYAIRHPWKGPIACATPTRGVWGGPWTSASAPKLTSATSLGLQAHAGANLAALTTATDLGGTALGAAEVVPALDGGVMATPDAGAPTATPPKTPPANCGCNAVGAGTSAGGLAAFLVGAMAWLRRRRVR